MLSLKKTVKAGICLSALCAVIAVPAFAQDPDTKVLNSAPLPGDGIAVNAAGELVGDGALQLNIPVAYVPAPDNLIVGAYFGGAGPGSRSFVNRNVSVATTIPGPMDIYVSAMQLGGRIFRSVEFSGQVQIIPEEEEMPAISVGVQDLFNAKANNFSLYIVGTRAFQMNGKTIYGTLGLGGGRFKAGVFGGASMPLSDSFNVAAEWDGFQLNTVLAYRPDGKHGKVTLIGGYNGRKGAILGATAGITVDIF